MNKLLLVLLITFVIATIAIQYGMAQDEEEFHMRQKRQFCGWPWCGSPWCWCGPWGGRRRRPLG
uniref:Uncharacterized protein n=1 Tax=Meloidogyne enterolobii TaxID=390850 RepID=A0A6V7UXD2_MELEN|nr:unnamed protein product [Meloidogyne enterolobii]